MKKHLVTIWLSLLCFVQSNFAQEISVRGGTARNITISSGDTSPRESDGTSFGSQGVSDGGRERTFRIRNLQASDGFPFTGDLSYSISENSQHFAVLGITFGLIGEGEFYDFTVRFDPTSTGRKTATISIANNDPDGNENPYTFRVEGTGVGVAEMDLFGLPNLISNGTAISDGDTSPRSSDGTDFGTVDALAKDKENTFRIRNTGTGTLTLSASDDSSHYQILSMPSSVAPGDSRDFRIRFNPRQSGRLSANITINNNDPNEDPYTFRVTGFARAPEIRVRGGITSQNTSISSGDTSPRTTDGTQFGSRDLDAPPLIRTFVIDNLQSSDGIPFTGDLTTSIRENSSQFSIGVAPILPIGEGSSATFTVVFNPTRTGTHRATISIDNNDPDGNEDPYTFVVEGTATAAPEIQVLGQPNLISNGTNISDGDTSPRSEDGTDFGTVDVNAPLDVTKTFRVRNTGSSTLTLSLSDNSSQFISSGLVSAIAPGGFDDFTIRFNPNRSGTHTATVTITNNDSNENPFTFDLRGLARAPEIEVRGGSPLQNVTILSGDTTPRSDDGTLFPSRDVADTPLSRTFRIRNLQNDDGIPFTGDLTVAISENSSHFSITSAPLLPIGEASSATFNVVFDPTAPGTHRATITIDNNDPDGDEDPYSFVVEGTATVAPEIQVLGQPNLISNGTNISDGDTSPRSEDGTDFGTVDVNAPLDVTKTFRVRNTGSFTLTLSLSDNSSQFISSGLVSAIAPGGFDDFTIRFNPNRSGTHTATVTITNNDSNENPFAFDLRGLARAPEIEVRGGSPLQNVTILSGDTTPRSDDGTLFPSRDVADAPLAQTFRIRNLQNDDGIPFTGDLTVAISENSSHFSIASAPLLPIGEASSATFNVVFDPTAPGTHRATITIDNNDPDGNEDPYTFVLEGTATAAPEIRVLGQPNLISDGTIIIDGDNSPRPEDGTDFGQADATLPIKQSRTFRVRNVGSARLTVLLTESSPHFDIQQGLDSGIDPGEFDDFTIRFDPLSDGTHTATVTIINNDDNESPFTFVIRGVATAPEIEVRGGGTFDQVITSGDLSPELEDNTDFGSTNVLGGAVENTFRILHRPNPDGKEGTLPLVITGISINNANFQITSPLLPVLPLIVLENTFTPLTVRFDPLVPGVHEAIVTINHNDPDGNEQPYRFRIVGRADQSEIEVSGGAAFDQPIAPGDETPAVVDGTDLGVVDLGTETVSARSSFQIHNAGDVPLNFGMTVASPHFQVSPDAGEVPQGESITVNLTYAPLEAGDHEAECRIVSNDLDLPQFNFRVKGQAVVPAISVTGSTGDREIPHGQTVISRLDGTDFGEVMVGETASQSVRIHNGGTSPLMVTATEDSPDFSLGLPGEEIAPGGSSDVLMTFEPSSLGEKRLIVELASNDPDQPSYSFTIGGTGIESGGENGVRDAKLTFTANQKELSFTARLDRTYRIEISTRLDPDSWTPLPNQPPISGAGELVTVDLAEFMRDFPAPGRFFRIVEQE